MATTARFGSRIVEVRLSQCTADEAVGDLVKLVGKTGEGKDIVSKADPTQTKPAVGVIVSKPSDTSCLTQWVGETPAVFAGLSVGDIYFLGADSKLSSAPPDPPVGATIFSQIVAVATAADRVYMKPELTRFEIG